jgi:hypothetical protein
MDCDVCHGKGLVTLNWADAEPDYALCLCPVGLDMRGEVGPGKRQPFALWQVWAARAQVDPSRIVLLEEALTPSELQACGFGLPARPTLMASVAAAAQSKNAKDRR